MKYFGASSYGLAGMLNDGIGVVLDGTGEVVLVADLYGLANSRSKPRHFDLESNKIADRVEILKGKEENKEKEDEDEYEVIARSSMQDFYERCRTPDDGEIV